MKKVFLLVSVVSVILFSGCASSNAAEGVNNTYSSEVTSGKKSFGERMGEKVQTKVETKVENKISSLIDTVFSGI